MKKTIPVLLIFVLLVTGIFMTGFALAETPTIYPVNAQENTLTPNMLLPKDLYMQVQSPRITARDSEYIYVANDKSLYVLQGKNTYEYAICQNDEEIIVAMVCVNTNVFLLTKERYKYTLIMLNPKSGERQTIIPEGIQNVVGIYSDGATLYLRNTSSEFYKKDGENFTKIEGINTVITSQSKVDAVITDKVYSLTTDNEIVLADSGETILRGIPSSAKDFAIINNEIYVLTDTAVQHYVNGAVLKSIQLSGTISAGISDIFIYGKLIYLTSSTDNRIYLYNFELTPKGYYGDKGLEERRLNTPSDVSAYAKRVYTSDTNNMRVTVFNAINNEVSHVALDIAPTNIVGMNNGFAIFNGKNILVYTDSVLTQTINMSQYDAITDLAYTSNDVDVNGSVYSGGTMFALLNDGSIMAISLVDTNKISLLTTAQNGKKIVVPEGNSRLYVLQDSIHRISLENGYNEDTGIRADSVSDFVVDFGGNIFTLNPSRDILSRHVKSDDGYVKDKDFTLNNVHSDSVLTFEVFRGNIWLTSPTAHTLTYIDSNDTGAYSTVNNQYDHPANFNIIRLGLLNTDTTVYNSPNNTEAVRKGTAGSRFLILAESEYNNNIYYYGVYEDNDRREYILKSEINMCEYKTYADKGIVMTPILYSGTFLYKYPYNYSSIVTTVSKGDDLTLISDVASNENGLLWGWYKVSYMNASGAVYEGYVRITDVQTKEDTQPPKLKKYYKVRAEKVGVKVSMYKDSNETSQILFDDIKDGTEVLVYQSAFDKDSLFTCVYYNDTIGFIKTANLIPSGLTVNQIIAISVASVGIVILLIVTILLIRRMRRLKDKDIYN